MQLYPQLLPCRLRTLNGALSRVLPRDLHGGQVGGPAVGPVAHLPFLADRTSQGALELI